MATPQDTVLQAVEELQTQGLFLSAHDRAMTAIADGLDGDRLRHLAVLTLARAGATLSALGLLRQLRLVGSDDPEIAGLYPRLLKDIALDSGSVIDAAAAGAAYTALWERHGDGWYGVNAAAMALLAGDPGRARDLAAAVRALADSQDYWSAATQGEAAFLLGDTDAAGRWLARAEARAGRDLSCRATTHRQLGWEAGLLGVDAAPADLLVIPDTIHFCGLIPGAPADEAQLRAQLEQLLRPVGFAFGGLAAGADIVVVEMLLALGALVTVVLPFPPEVYLDQSVIQAGAAWVPRYRACLERVTVQVLETVQNDDLDYGLASRRAMGLACLHARRLESRSWQLAIWDGGGSAGPAGTAADVAAWRGMGGRTHIIESPWPRRRGAAPAGAVPQRTAKAVLFGDLPRFSELDDAALLAFYTGPLVAMGRVVDETAPLYRNAWGDAVQLVFDDPATAALCAFRLRATASAGQLTAAGLPATLVPRLAMDFGGLYPVFDPVQQATKFAGRVMTRAARIEPVTPPGSIYATEAFACEAALMANAPIACDYAGRVPLAKSFGTLPLYAVHPKRHAR